MLSSHIIRALLAGLLWSSCAATLQAQVGQTGAILPSARVLDRYGLEMAWWNQAVVDPARDTIEHVSADEEVVYLQTTAGTVTAFDARDGRKIWASQLGRPDQPGYPVTSNDELALVTIGQGVYAVEKWTGRLAWQIKLPGVPSSRPVTDERRMYIGMLDGSVYCFDLRKIRELFQKQLLPQWSYQTVKWRFKTAERIPAPPVPIGSTLFFASADKSLYAVSAEESNAKFQLETDDELSAPLAAANDLLYLASRDFNIYAVNQTSGRIRWKFVTGLPVQKAPITVEDDLFVAPERGGVYMLKGTTGRQIWWRPRLVEFVAATDRLAFVTNSDEQIVIVNRATGDTIGTLPFQRYTNRLINDRTDRLVLAMDSGLVVMIRERDREFPRYFKFPENQPIRPTFADEAPAADADNAPQP